MVPCLGAVLLAVFSVASADLDSTCHVQTAVHSRDSSSEPLGHQHSFTDLRVHVAEDRQGATISLESDGQVTLYDLAPASVFARGAQLLRHTDTGTLPIVQGSPRIFRSRTRGRRAILTQLPSGLVSGSFELGGKLYRLEPHNETDDEVLLRFAAARGGEQLRRSYFKTHRASVIEAPSLMSEVLQRGAQMNDLSSWLANSTVPPYPHGGRTPSITIDKQTPEMNETARGRIALGKTLFDGEPFFPGCYEGDSQIHTIEIGVIGDFEAFQKYGEELTTMMSEMVALASFVYEGQMNLELLIGYMVVYESVKDAPSYANGCGPTGDFASDDDYVSKLYDIRNKYHTSGIPFEGAVHIFTGCGPDHGTIGVAFIDSVCNPYGYNVGTSKIRGQPHTPSAWLTFAHELGHLLGALHSFEDGMGQTGGIMDYGDGTYQGTYQFHKYRKNELCHTLEASLHTCSDKFLTKDVSPTPAPITCEDSPTDWLDVVGDGCAAYEMYHWCAATGDFGPAWNPDWGSFALWASKTGVSADQACCACGGGNRTTPMPTSSPTMSPTQASPLSVTGYITLDKMDYTALASNSSLVAELLLTCRLFIANASGVGMLVDDVEAELQPFSTIIGFSIFLPESHSNADAAVSGLTSADATVELLHDIESITGIQHIASGNLSVRVTAEKAVAQAVAPANVGHAVAPAKAESGQAAAFGDPHLKNVRGEKFNVQRSGNHTFLAIPFGASPANATLHLQARIEHRGQSCGQLYITQVVITGRRLGSLKRLEFSTKIDDFDARTSRGFKVGEAAAQTAEEFAARVPDSGVIGKVKLYHPKKPTGANQHVTMVMVRLDVGFGRIKVCWELQREKDGESSWLWLAITGLSKVRERIGGLLGMEDHSRVALKPEECVARHGRDLPSGRVTSSFVTASASLSEGAAPDAD